MDGTTADIGSCRVPKDDGRIAGAIGQLDELLSAWSSAMRDAQRQLTTRLEKIAAEETKPFSNAKPGETTAVLDEEPPQEDEPVTDVESRPKDRVPDPETTTGRITEKSPEAVSDAAAAEEAEKTSEAEGTDAGTETRVDDDPEPDASETVHEDEEAILAGLDEETATKIRVMRRLSSTSKSVSELLKELSESKPNSENRAEPKKSSWFSRGR